MSTVPKIHRLLRTLLLASFAAATLASQSAQDRFDKRTAMIAMRDGVRLNTEIYTPKQRQGPLPILLERTPYSIRHDRDGFASSLTGPYRELADSGYVFVFQDIRGKYGSEGTFVMVRPPRQGTEQIDESTDAHDTIDWLLQEVEGHNGRVGMLGISYGGWLTMMALLEPHPALRAASPQASPECMWTGDDFYHRGAFRLSYAFEYVALVDGGKENVAFQFDRLDTYDWFLRLGGLAAVDQRFFHGQRPTWNDFVAHPDFDAFWQRRKVAPYFAGRKVAVPTLTVAGWWDQEDFHGPLTLYAAMEQNDPDGLSHLVVGPWNHGGWARGDGSSLGAIPFGTRTAEFYRSEVQARWFAYWLKDQGERDFPEALTFRPGSNAWQRYERWPPVTGVTAKRLHLRSGGRLSFSPPTADDAPSTSFVSDPGRPVPYRQRPIHALYRGKVASTWAQWMVDDQRHAQSRPDVLTFESDVLDADVTICGPVVARLFASTTGSDADWIVKLIDVYPEQFDPPQLGGWQLMVLGDVLRSRYRGDPSRPEPLTPGEVTALAVDLHAIDYTFRKGHRIMVQVQSTWFPLIDRNPQRFVPNIFHANEGDYVAATHTLWHSIGQPSGVDVMLLR